MYGPTQAYLDSPSQGDKQVTLDGAVKQLENTIVVRGRGNKMMTIHCEKGMFWLKCILTYGEHKNRIEEYLVCEDVKSGVFLLTSRLTHGKVSITTVARRHSMFPLNTRVRMRVLK